MVIHQSLGNPTLPFDGGGQIAGGCPAVRPCATLEYGPTTNRSQKF